MQPPSLQGWTEPGNLHPNRLLKQAASEGRIYNNVTRFCHLSF